MGRSRERRTDNAAMWKAVSACILKRRHTMKKQRAYALEDSTGSLLMTRGAPRLYIDSWCANDAAEREARHEGGVIYRIIVVELRKVGNS